MGWSPDRILDKSYLTEEVECPICTTIVKNPVQTPCEHVFCNDCIKDWLQTGNFTCPVDRHELSESLLKPPSRIIQKFLDGLTIRCQNHELGCNYTTKLGNAEPLYNQENNECSVKKYYSLHEKFESIKGNLDDKDRTIKTLEFLLQEQEAKISELRSKIDDQSNKLDQYKSKIKSQRREMSYQWTKAELSIKRAMDEIAKNRLEAAKKNMGDVLSTEELSEQQSSKNSTVEYQPSAPEILITTDETSTEPVVEQSDQIEIFVECWIENECKTISVISKSSEKIADLKDKLKEKTGVSPPNQVIQRRTAESRRFRSRFVCRDLVCQDAETLSSCDIKENDTISLVNLGRNLR